MGRVRAGGEADFLEIRRNGPAVLVRHVFHRVARHARDAQLNLGLGENRVDRLGKPGKAVHRRYQDIADAPVFQLVQ